MLLASSFHFAVGSQVLIRCDLNVPLDDKKITDDTRIRASVETIKYLVSKGARVAVSRPHFQKFAFVSKQCDEQSKTILRTKVYEYSKTTALHCVCLK